MGIGDSFPGSKMQDREADHSPPSSSEAKNGGAIPPLPDVSSWHRGNFTFISLTFSVPNSFPNENCIRIYTSNLLVSEKFERNGYLS
jgi:hypothetical protein